MKAISKYLLSAELFGQALLWKVLAVFEYHLYQSFWKVLAVLRVSFISIIILLLYYLLCLLSHYVTILKSLTRLKTNLHDVM